MFWGFVNSQCVRFGQKKCVSFLGLTWNSFKIFYLSTTHRVFCLLLVGISPTGIIVQITLSGTFLA